MHILVLGAGAGGGLPQWNCGCRNCADARTGSLPSMTQSSVAVSADGDHWLVLNASPDIRAQLAASPPLHPRGLRQSPVSGVVLTNGDLDHVAGLLTLREKTGFTVYASGEVIGILRSNAIFEVLDSELVRRETITLDTTFSPLPEIDVTPFAVPGKVPLYMEDGEIDLSQLGEQTLGLRVASKGRVAYYVPGCAALPDDLVDRFSDADLLLFDGTVWEDADMQRTGTGQKTGTRMGHGAMIGPGGSLERLARVTCRKVYVHVNNTNPVLQPDSEERRSLEAAGWELAQDGMRFDL